MRPNRGFAPASGDMVIAAGGRETRYASVTASRAVWCRIQIET